MAFFSADQLALLSAGDVRVAFLVEFQFDAETVHVWNGAHEISSGGKTWSPMKGAARIDGLSVGIQQQSDNVTFTLSGIGDADVDLLALALQETPDVAQRTVLVYLQLFDADWQPNGSPIAIWWGFMQPPSVSRTALDTDGQAHQTIALTAENAFFNRSRPPYGRYTDRDQQKRSPGDKFFQFTAGLLFSVWTYPDY